MQHSADNSAENPVENLPPDQAESAAPAPTSTWRQGECLDVEITGLSDRGDGVGRWEDRVVFVPDTVPGDRVYARLLHVKPSYAQARMLHVLKSSSDRVRPPCIVADKCGGCQWQPVAYDQQLQAKYDQVVQALTRIGDFVDPVVHPILPAPAEVNYRNKATFPLGRNEAKQVQAGYYRKGSHRIVNLNQCPVQDDRLNPLLAGVKQDIQTRGWSIYDETKHQGKLRHLALRIGRRTGEILLTLVSTEWNVVDLEEQAAQWLQTYPNLVGVAINQNSDRTNRIFGDETRCVAGQIDLTEEFAGLQFKIQPTTFFQVNTEQAEALVQHIQTTLALTGTETLMDAYCGIGTLTLPLARQSQRAIGLEQHEPSVQQARQNAELNQITNAEFHIGTVATLLQTLDVQPDVVVVDPPRKGCDRAVIDQLRQRQPERIVYMSCNPATLARDLNRLCAEGLYDLQQVQPADFFPQTAHVECVAYLVRAAAY